MNTRQFILRLALIVILTPFAVALLFYLDARVKRPLVIGSGSYTGTVLDESTGRPVEGAAVYMAWWWSRRLNLMESLIEWENAGDNVYIGEALAFTDAEGRYRMPDKAIKSWIRWRAPSPEVRVLVYKKGYVAWNNATIFDGELPQPAPDKEQRLKKKSATINLLVWQSTYSHLKHHGYITPMVAGKDKRIRARIRSELDWEASLPQQLRDAQ